MLLLLHMQHHTSVLAHLCDLSDNVIFKEDVALGSYPLQQLPVFLLALC